MQAWYFPAYIPQVQSAYRSWQYLGSFAVGRRLFSARFSVPKMPACSLVEAIGAR
jgi:hypothetical protein